jgi:endonuclease/exonuclease/phosphatase family metal-dependent hydrolase
MAELTLVTFNTHYGLGPLRDDCTPYDLMQVLAGLGEPDVMVIQEVWRPGGERALVDDFADAHGYTRHDVEFARATMHARWPRPDVHGEGTVGLAVLSRLPATVIDRPAIGPTVGDPVPHRRVLRLEVDVAGTLVDLVGVHLTSRLPHGPPVQLRRLARLLGPTVRPGIVTGDCNFWGPPVSALLPGWSRAVRGRTWPAPRPHSQIDHVLVRGGIEVIDGTVLPAMGSDHRPVRTRLRVPDPSPGPGAIEPRPGAIN